MLSKNNFNEKLRKMSAKTERFSIRKLSVGAASVLIGLTFMGMSGNTVHADSQDAHAGNSGANLEQKADGDADSDAVHNAKEVTVNNGHVKAAAQSTHDENQVTGNKEVAKTEVKAPETKAVSDKKSDTPVVNAVPNANDDKQNASDDQKASDNNGEKDATKVVANKDKKKPETQTLDLTKNNGAKVDAKSLGESKVATNAAVQPTYTADEFNNDWDHTGDASNLTITGYKHLDQVAGKDIIIPNSAELRAAGVLNNNVEAQITYDAVHNLVTHKAKSITINAGDKKEDRLLAVGGANGANDTQWLFAFGYTPYVNKNDPSYDNTTLEKVNLAGLDVSNVTNFDSMFARDTSLTKVTGLDTWDVSRNNNFGHMFYGDKSLVTVQGLDNWNTSSLQYMDNMFNGDTSLGSNGSTLNLAGWKTNNVKNASYMFNNASALTSVGDLSSWRFPNLTNSSYMFNDARKLNGIGNLNNWGMGNDTAMRSMFKHAEALTNVGNLSGWQTGKVTNMQGMFDFAHNLTNLGDLSGWDVSQVTDFGQMFREDWDDAANDGHGQGYDVGKLNFVGDLSTWNTQSATNMAGMFQGTSITKLNVGGWNVSKVGTNNSPAGQSNGGFDYMFDHMPDLISVGDLSSWKTGNATSMFDMFADTPKLTLIGDISGWNVSKVLDANRMFADTGIKNINISSWKFNSSLAGNHEKVNDMFANLVNPTTIIANDITNVPVLNTNDFRGNQPLIVISNKLDANALNTGTVADGTTGHVANTVTFVLTSDKNTPIAHQQQNFVFANQDALNKALNYIKTDGNINNVPYGNGTLENKYVAGTGDYLNGKHNATGTDYGQNTDYGKIAGTYSVQIEQDVTQDLIRQNDPHLQKATATYRVVEKFPDYYNGTNTLTADQYARAIGDSAHASNYAGYKYKIVLSQPITAYRAATKNLLTGDINYDGPYSLANSDLNGSVGFDPNDKSHVENMALDHPDHYDISANPPTYRTSDILDSRNQPVLNYAFNAPTDTTGPTFTYDLINGYQTDENKVTFNTLPASQTFYINYTAQTEDVTQTEIDNGTYPDAHKKTATYQVIERFPSDYAGALNADGSLKSGYTRNGDFIERVIANQTVTAYQTATKNLATGDISYSTDFNCKYVKFASTTPDKSVVDPSQDLWSHQYSSGDETLINKSPVDTPDGFTISADPASYVTSENDANGNPMLQISCDAANHTFSYDFMNGTSDGNASDQLKFNALPASHNFYIDYTAKQQSVKIQFIDTENNNQPVPNSEITKSGTTDQTIQLDLTDNNIPAGYELAEGQTLPTDYKFTANNNQTITVKLKHKVSTIDGDNIPEGGQTPDGQPLTDSDFKQTITRTITAELPSGNRDLSQTTDITRTAKYDEVTKKVTSWGDWSKGNFDVVDVPQVSDYTAQINGQDAPGQISAVSNVTDGYTDPKIKITYKANQQSITINYKDADGNTIGTATVSGTTGETKDNNVSNHVPAGWKLVDGQTVPSQTNFTYGQDGQPSFHDINVKIEHATVTVQPNDPKTPSDNLPDNPGEKYPAGVSQDDLNKTITRTIKITKPDGTVVDKTQTLHFERTATVDEVTKQITYGNWTPANGSAGSFGEVDIPDVPGYSASQDDVPAQTLTDDEITNWQDNPVNISYSANSQTTEIIYKTADGKQVGTTVLNGMTDQTVDVNPVAPEGYWIDKNSQNIPSTYTFKASDNQPITVIVVKKEESKGDPTNDDKEVGVIVEYKDPSGKVIKTDIIAGKPGETIQVPHNIPDGYEIVGDAPTTYTVNRDGKQVIVINVAPIPAPDDNHKGNDDNGGDNGNDNHEPTPDNNNQKPDTNKPAKHHKENSGIHGINSAVTKNKSKTHSAAISPAAQKAANAKQLPQTGEDNTKALGLLGTILASMGIATAFGAKKRKKN